jgi:hypothetical protein
MAVLCAVSACLNALAMMVFRLILKTPLYLDTMFTVSAAFYGGLWPGVLTGLLTNLIISTVRFTGWGVYLYTICNIIAALVTALLIRLCPNELDLWDSLSPVRLSGGLSAALYRLTALFLLAFAQVVALSVSGGFIGFCIQRFIPGPAAVTGPEVFYAAPLKRMAWPSLLVEIIARIPVNVLDRLLTVFCGYALARGLKKALRRTAKPRSLFSGRKTREPFPRQNS